MSTSPALVLIAAMDRHRAIGRAGGLPWHLPDDLKRFKALTLGKPILMGRKTAQSLGRALPGRQNLVLTHAVSAPFAGMQAVASLEAALVVCVDADELWVIGGGQVYSLCLPRAQRLVLTDVDTRVADADTYFPPIDAVDWQLLSEELHPADARHPLAMTFRDYVRRRPTV